MTFSTLLKDGSSESTILPNSSPNQSQPTLFRNILIAVKKGHSLLLICFLLARICFTPIVPVTAVVTLFGVFFFFIHGVLIVFDQAKFNSTHSLTLPTTNSVHAVDYYSHWVTFYLFLTTASCLPLIASLFRISTWHLKWPLLFDWLLFELWDVYTSWSFSLFPFLLRALELEVETKSIFSSPFLFTQLSSASLFTSIDSLPPQENSSSSSSWLSSRSTSLFFLIVLLLHIAVSLFLLIIYGTSFYSSVILGTAVAYCWIWFFFQLLFTYQSSHNSFTFPNTFSKLLGKHD